MKCIYSKKRHRVFVLFRFVTHHHTYDAREPIKSNRTSKRKQQTSMMKKGTPCVNASINFSAMPIAITDHHRHCNYSFIGAKRKLSTHSSAPNSKTHSTQINQYFRIVVNLSVDGIEWIRNTDYGDGKDADWGIKIGNFTAQNRIQFNMFESAMIRSIYLNVFINHSLFIGFARNENQRFWSKS